MKHKNYGKKKVELIETQITFNCICNEQIIVFLEKNDHTIIECIGCKTEWIIKAIPTIKKTSKQINRELGF